MTGIEEDQPIQDQADIIASSNTLLLLLLTEMIRRARRGDESFNSEEQEVAARRLGEIIEVYFDETSEAEFALVSAQELFLDFQRTNNPQAMLYLSANISAIISQCGATADVDKSPSWAPLELDNMLCMNFAASPHITLSLVILSWMGKLRWGHLRSFLAEVTRRLVVQAQDDCEIPLKFLKHVFNDENTDSETIVWILDEGLASKLLDLLERSNPEPELCVQLLFAVGWRFATERTAIGNLFLHLLYSRNFSAIAQRLRTEGLLDLSLQLMLVYLNFICERSFGAE